MGFYKINKKINLENEVEEVIIEEPATIEDVVEQDITNSEPRAFIGTLVYNPISCLINNIISFKF